MAGIRRETPRGGGGGKRADGSLVGFQAERGQEAGATAVRVSDRGGGGREKKADGSEKGEAGDDKTLALDKIMDSQRARREDREVHHVGRHVAALPGENWWDRIWMSGGRTKRTTRPSCSASVL